MLTIICHNGTLINVCMGWEEGCAINTLVPVTKKNESKTRIEQSWSDKVLLP